MTALIRTLKTFPLLFPLLLPLLAACTTTPPPAQLPPPPCVAPPPAAPGEVAMLLAYHHGLRALGAAELSRELSLLNGQEASLAVTLRKAMVLAQGRSTAELAAAQQLLDNATGAGPQDEGLLQLAELLGARLAEQRRATDSADKLAQQQAQQMAQQTTQQLTQQLKDSQRRNEQLNEKLEALKAIERTLPAAPGAAASNGK